MKPANLPKVAVWMLSRLAVARNRLSLIGDMEEEYALNVCHLGWLERQRWMCSEILLPSVSFLRTHHLWRKAMFSNYFKIAFRNLKRKPGYSAINIVGLAVGMAACILIFLWVQDELSFDRFHQNQDRIYRIIQQRDGQWFSSSPFSLARTLKQDFPDIELASRFLPRTLLLSRGDQAFYEPVSLVDPDFLNLFSFPLVKGDPHTALDTERMIVLTETATKKYFGTEDPVGQILTLNGNQEATVTGIIQDPPANSSMQFGALVNFKVAGEQMDQSWWLGCDAYLLLRQGTEVETFIDKIVGTTVKYDRRVSTNNARESLQPLARVHLYGLNDTGPILYVVLFSLIAVVVLAIACVNFINLTTAQASKRAKEIGLRKTVGGSRASIVRQLYGETLLLSLMAFVVALILVALTLPGFNQLAGKTLSLSTVGRPMVILGILVIALFAGLASGSYPALFLSRFKPIQVLRQGASQGARNPMLRRVLVIFQFTMAVILIVSSLTLTRQMRYIHNKDLGFVKENIVRLTMNRDLQRNYPTFKERLLQHPEILSVTAANNTPVSITNVNPFYWEGRGPDQYETFNFVSVDFDYFETFGLKMAQGRSFTTDFTMDSSRAMPGYILNEAALRQTKLEDPLGKMFSIWTNEGRIVGIVKDFHSRSLHSEINPVVFICNDGFGRSRAFIRYQPGTEKTVLAIIEKEWKALSPGFPFNYDFLDDVFEGQYASDARIGRIFNAFTYLAIFISCLGLLGLAAFLAEQRTREIGIRKVLGASALGITGLMSREFLLLLGISNLLAWPAAWWAMRKMLNGWAYHASLSWWIFIASGLTAVAIALATVSYQSLRAARTNPARALKYE